MSSLEENFQFIVILDGVYVIKSKKSNSLYTMIPDSPFTSKEEEQDALKERYKDITYAERNIITNH
jgi:hypothetical protein